MRVSITTLAAIVVATSALPIVPEASLNALAARESPLTSVAETIINERSIEDTNYSQAVQGVQQTNRAAGLFKKLNPFRLMKRILKMVSFGRKSAFSARYIDTNQVIGL
jgi:hypothetical protein